MILTTPTMPTATHPRPIQANPSYQRRPSASTRTPNRLPVPLPARPLAQRIGRTPTSQAPSAASERNRSPESPATNDRQRGTTEHSTRGCFLPIRVRDRPRAMSFIARQLTLDWEVGGTKVTSRDGLLRPNSISAPQRPNSGHNQRKPPVARPADRRCPSPRAPGPRAPLAPPGRSRTATHRAPAVASAIRVRPP